MPNLHTLLPTDIEKGTPQHKAVDRLKEALANNDVHNIAITGAYGSGKSSVITTFLHENEEDKEVKDKYCTISLATIEALNDIEEEKEQSKGSEVKVTGDQGSEGKTAEDQKVRTDKATEAKLNRRIEYSILQQLIYKEEHTKLPKSRFKKIPFISKVDAEKYSLWIVSCIICWLIAFEPEPFRIFSLYTYFERTFGILNFVFDWIATIWLIVSACVLTYKIIRHYSGLSLKKISVANADIDIDEERSVFNDYLEEIIYFFQETKYNIVFIEDLDRFDSTYIFLKLRELNTLLNRSNILKACFPIRFVYAIRDDLFVDSGRTKFFDEIIPVIPVINPSNAAEKLKESLKPFDLQGKVNDEDLTDMAYFIKDMRLLKNIANEFSLYNGMLNVKDNHLSPTKLMAMMIYKNLYPRDFGKLPNREGVLYTVLSRDYKKKFIQFAKEVAITERRKYWEEQKEIKDNTQVHNETELRRLYLLSFYKLNELRLDTTIELGDRYRGFDEIVNSENVFLELTQSKHCSYSFYDSYYRQHGNGTTRVDFTAVENNVDPKHSYKERLKALNLGNEIDHMLYSLDLEENRLGTYRVKDFLNKFPEVTKTDWYETLHVPYLIEFFLRRGFLDEDFYDYVSYHYNGISTDQDHDTLMRLKNGLILEYTRPVDNVRSLINSLTDNNKKIFDTDQGQINCLCDVIISEDSYKEQRDLFLHNLYQSARAAEFLNQYLHLGKYPDELFGYFVNHDQQYSWNEFTTPHGPTITDELIREWIKVVNIDKGIYEEAQNWISTHYEFIDSNSSYIGLDKIEHLVLDAPVFFMKLTPSNSTLLNFICEHNRYVPNPNNISVLSDLYNERETVTPDNLNLTRIFNTGNEALIGLTKDNINNILNSISPTAKDEDESSMLYVLNHEKIKVEDKQKFLEGQINKISKISDITAVADRRIAIMTNVLAPTWENIDEFLVNATNDDKSLLNEFISKNVTILSNAGSALDVDNSDELFNRIINSDFISDDAVYSQLLEAFAGYTMSSQIYPQTKGSRLVLLIEKEFIPYSEQYKLQIKSIDDIAYSHYLEHNWKELTGELKESDLTDTSVLYLLQSIKLTEVDKSTLITKIPQQIMDNNAEVATEVSKELSTYYQFVGYPFMYSVIQNSTDDEYRLPVAIATIQHAIENKDGNEVIIEVVKSLGGHYADLLDNSKKPTYENSIENYKLLSLLRQCKVISSFKEEDGKRLRVFHGHKN